MNLLRVGPGFQRATRQDLFLARPHVCGNSRVDLLALLSCQFLVALAWCPSRVLQVAPDSVIEVRAFCSPSAFAGNG